jgi:hypothetical protein
VTGVQTCALPILFNIQICSFQIPCDEPLATEVISQLQSEFSDRFVWVENVINNDPWFTDDPIKPIVGNRWVRGLYVPQGEFSKLPIETQKFIEGKKVQK